MTHWLPKEQCNLQSGSNEASEWAGFLCWWNSQTDGSSHFHGGIFERGKSLAVISRLILSTVDTWTLGLTGGFPTWKLWLEAFTQSCHRRCNWELKHQRDWTLEPCLVIPSAKAPKSLLLHGCSRFKWFKCWGCKNINIESIKKHQRASNNIEIYRTA